MGERPLTDLGRQMLTTLPPVLRESHSYQAIQHCYAREIERLEGCIEQVRAQFNPATADVLLPAWEFELRLPVGGQGSSIDERRQRVLARLRKVTLASEGREWEADVTAIIGAGWGYREHDTADGTSPPAGTLLIVLPFAAGSDAYINAQTELRDVIPAHLAITYESSDLFRLDISELDVTQFGV